MYIFSATQFGKVVADLQDVGNPAVKFALLFPQFS